MRLILVLSLLISSLLFAEEKEIQTAELGVAKPEHTVGGDLKTTINDVWKGSYLQFTDTPSWVILAASAPLLTYFFIEDKRISKNITRQKKYGYENLVSNLGIAVNMQIIPVSTYIIGRNYDNEKLIRYSQELMSANLLAMLETNFISWIPIHKRPSPDNLAIWETAFRYESSFPSGHVLGYFVTGMKTLQYYGPLPAAPFFALGWICSAERVKTDKHYLSDVVAAGVLSILASEGVRIAANNKDNHPIYKWIFEHEVKVGYVQENGSKMAMLGLTY